jgi:hypothetical protein
MKPSRQIMPAMEDAEACILEYLRHQLITRFVYVYSHMLDKKGQPMPALFV